MEDVVKNATTELISSSLYFIKELKQFAVEYALMRLDFINDYGDEEFEGWSYENSGDGAIITFYLK